MSFVLDALKRREADGNPDAAVALATATTARQRHRLWRALFAVAMLVNVVLLAWFGGFDWLVSPAANGPPTAPVANQQRAVPESSAAGRRGAAETPASDTASRQPAEPKPDPVAATAPAPAPAARAAGPSRPEPAAAAPTRRPAPAAEPADEPPAAPARPEVLRLALSELPDDVRRRLPGMAFSTHVYADDPELRAIVANGERLTEGQRIRGLEILEITEGGVVLGFERYQVEVPIVTDWD